MPKIRLTVAAQQDLSTIQNISLDNFGVMAVREHMRGFERIFTLLHTHPAADEARLDYGDGIRIFSHRPPRIIYHFGDHDILILRILHAAMDAASALERRP